MSFIEQSEKNTKKYNSSFKERKKSVPLLKEVSGGEVAGFTGRAGRDIDAVFAGGYHPDSGHGSKNLELLTKQIEDRKKKRAEMEKKAYEDGVELVGVPSPIGGYFDTETEIALAAYEELAMRSQLVKQYSDENTPLQDTEWKSTGWNYDFDDIYIHIDNEEDFINKSETNMKKVGVDIKYDDEPEYAGEDFINRSQTNWKIVGSK